jgi:phosphoglycolate phosphatase-like HAD superfamily hydrolase
METADRLPVIICDVDGTLCDVRSIRHYVERPGDAERFRANFALFHSSSEDCPAFPAVLKLVKDLERAGYGVVIVTAREARWVEVTERWLDRQGIRRVELITRPALDYRSDAVVKAEICADIQRRYAPRLAIDDRDDILAVWTAAAIPTLKVGHAGDLSPVTWPGTATDQRITAVVEEVMASQSPSSSRS